MSVGRAGRGRWAVAVAMACVLAVGCASGTGETSSTAAGATSSGSTGSASAPTTDTSLVTTTIPVPTTPPAIVSSSTTAAPTTADPGVFAATDRALQARVSSAGLPGGAVLVMRDGKVIHDHAVGRVSRTTPLSVASSAKWLTAIAVMTYVDEGKVALDDPVGKWLPELAGETPAVTVRSLLDHTSGVRDQGCLWNFGTKLADCVRLVAKSPRQFPAGTQFSYGNADFHVVGRMLEVLAGTDFATVMRQRVTGPLGMVATTWPGAPNNPSPAAGAQTTVDDYARLLAMIASRGMVDGRRFLSEASVGELVRNQVGAYDTNGDYSVGITKIPRYSLGAWPDVVDLSGATIVVSGNGGKGFYPWVDFSTNSYGVIGVQDDRGAEVAVPASQKVAVEARQAVK